MDIEDKEMGKKRSMWIRRIYIVGLSFWILSGIIAFCFLREKFLYTWLFLFPFLLCLVGLALNLVMWWKPQTHATYKIEVDVIEFVERNAGHLILAITAAVIAAQVIGSPSPAFVRYQLFALGFSICGVLPLIWIPSKDVEGLVVLRHIKTVFYFYGISCFLAGLISLLK